MRLSVQEPTVRLEVYDLGNLGLKGAVTSWVLAGVCTPRPLAPVRSRQPTPRPHRVQPSVLAAVVTNRHKHKIQSMRAFCKVLSGS